MNYDKLREGDKNRQGCTQNRSVEKKERDDENETEEIVKERGR